MNDRFENVSDDRIDTDLAVEALSDEALDRPAPLAALCCCNGGQ